MISSLLAQGTFWLEPPASTSAQNHDLVFYALLYVMAFFFFLVVTIMLAFVVLYRRRKGQAPGDAPTHNTLLEISWSVIPLGLVIAFFVVGLRYYVELESPPAGADVIDVVASQWQFNFKYPNGAESNELYLRVNRPVVLKLTSQDVTHALYIPAFRVQRNAVPGRNTEIWFQPTVTTGDDDYYHVFCTQYCGNGHAEMNARAFVLEKDDYDKKLAEAANIFIDRNSKQPLPYKEVGEKLYVTKGCSGCHSIDGSKGTGPTWKGLYKSDHQFDPSLSKSLPSDYTLKESSKDAEWDEYLRESILHPEAKIVQGFPNVMPSKESDFSGSPYKEKMLQAMIEYIKSRGDSKYYTQMKTPELTEGEKTPKADAAKPPASRIDDRWTDPSIDRSATPPPAAMKEEGK